MQPGALRPTIHRYVELMEALVQRKVDELSSDPTSEQIVDLREFIVPIMVRTLPASPCHSNTKPRT
jgi:hypothetical protein